MFHKEGSSRTTKGNKPAKDVPIRKSDRRNLRKRVEAVLAVDNKSTALLDTAFMQGQLLSRLVTLPECKATLYFRHPSQGNDEGNSWPYRKPQCVWIQLDSKLWFPDCMVVDVPGLALLALLADDPQNVLISTNNIPSPVSKFLCRGANLMRPGMREWIHPSRAPDGRAKAKGSQERVVTVAVHGNVQPMAVGLYESGGASPSSWDTSGSGVGVFVVSCYGDDLWDAEDDYGKEGFLQGKFVDSLNGSPIVSDPDTLPLLEEEETDPKVLNSKNEAPTTTEAAIDVSLSPEETLLRAVCQALSRLRKKDFPLRMATFYAQHVQNSEFNVDVKQTIYKKFGTFVARSVETGLLEVAADPNNFSDAMAMLVGYDHRNPMVREYRKTENEGANDSGSRLVLTDLYCVPSHFVDLLQLNPMVVKAATAASEARRNTGILTLKEMRGILEEYMDKEALVDSSDPKFITLNGPLTDALYGKKTKSVSSRLSRRDVVDLWARKMHPAYAIVRVPGNDVVKVARGKAPRVTLEVKRRQQRKYVTHLRGCSVFGVDGSTLRTDVAHRFGLAGSVESNDELIFQGNVADQLLAYLTGDASLSSHGGAKDSPYRLPRKAIDAVYRKGVPASKNKCKAKD